MLFYPFTHKYRSTLEHFPGKRPEICHGSHNKHRLSMSLCFIQSGRRLEFVFIEVWKDLRFKYHPGIYDYKIYSNQK